MLSTDRIVWSLTVNDFGSPVQATLFNYDLLRLFHQEISFPCPFCTQKSPGAYHISLCPYQRYCSIFYTYLTLLVGYEGEKCQTNIDDCSPDPCVNGVYVDGVSGYSCVCQAGFTGTNCSAESNECASRPCLNGATCIDLIGRFVFDVLKFPCMQTLEKKSRVNKSIMPCIANVQVNSELLQDMEPVYLNACALNINVSVRLCVS